MKEGVTIVIPCLNEQDTLPLVLERIASLRERAFADRPLEIIVSDNGSTDESVAIATRLGARVVPCPQRGYGAALQNGILNTVHNIVVFADADNTYDFIQTPVLVSMLEQGYDLVVGSRLAGTIQKGAMPMIHRYLGTPVLNFFINLLHARGGYRTSDCNSGFRCFRKDAFLTWGARASGMEFASEMLIKAMRANARIAEVPISLAPDLRQRTPHLKRWRDGMRHLLQILLEAPHFFYWSGIALFLASWLAILIGLLFGPFNMGFGWIFGLHTMMFAQLGSCLGLTVWSIGLFLSAQSKPHGAVYRYLVSLPEDKLFWYSFWFGMGCLSMLIGIAVYWTLHGRSLISAEKETVVVVTLSINGIIFVVNTLTAHLLRRS